MKRASRLLRTPGRVLAFLLVGGALAAQDGVEVSPWYFRFDAGVADLTDPGDFETDIGYQFSGALGRQVLDGEHLDLSLEGQVFYTRAAFEAEGMSDVEILGLFGNAVVDWRLWEKFGLYALGGVGFNTIDAIDDDGSGFGYQLGAGVRYRLGETVALSMGYRYVGAEDTMEVDGALQAFDLGVTWNLFTPSLLR